MRNTKRPESRTSVYAGYRHELLNETDREQVYEDLLEWMEERRKINY